MKNRKGLTLIEVIISIAIVGIVAMVILSAFSSSTKNISSANKRTINTLGTKDRLDELIIKSENLDTDWITIDTDNEDIEVEQDITINVTIPEVTGTKDIKGKVITVNSTDGEGNTITIETFVPDD